MPKLTIDIEARLASFQDSLTKIENQTSRFAGRLDKAFGGITRAFAPLAGLLSAGLFAGFVKGSIEAQAALDDLSEQTSLSVEFLSQLQQLTQVTGADLDQVAGAASRFAKEIGNALGGDKGAAQAFRDVGISIDDLRTKGIDELFTTFAKSIADAEDPTLAIGKAIALTGKAGAELIPVYKDLAKLGLEQARTNAEQSARAEELLNNFRRLQKGITDVGTDLANLLVPRLADVADELVKGVREGNAFIAVLKAIGQAFGFVDTESSKFVKETDRLLALQKRIGELESSGPAAQRNPNIQRQIDTARAEATALESQLQSIAKLRQQQDAANQPKKTPPRTAAEEPRRTGGGSARDPLASLDSQVLALQKQVVQLKEGDRAALQFSLTTGELGKITGKEAEKRRQAILALDDQVRSLKINEEAQKKFNEAVIDYDTAQAGLVEKVLEQEDALRRQAVELNSSSTATDRYVAGLEKLKDLLKFGLSTEAFQAQVIELGKTYETEIKKINDDTDGVKDVARDLGLTFSSAFEDAISGGKSFSDILKGIEKDLIRLGTRKLITEPLFEAFSGFLGDQASGGGFFGEFFKLFTKRADGGSVFAGRPYLVGERGPELFVPGRSGGIVPNGALGGGVNVTINMAGGTDSRTAGQIANEVGRAVQRAQRRNG